MWDRPRLPPHPPAVEIVGRNARHDVGEEGADDFAPQPKDAEHNGQDDERSERGNHRHHRVADDLQSLRGSAEAPQPDQGRSSWHRGYSVGFRCRPGLVTRSNPPSMPRCPGSRSLRIDPHLATLLRRGGRYWRFASGCSPRGGSGRLDRTGQTMRRTSQAIDGVAPQSELDAGRRRFTWAALIAIALTAVPFVWILWSDWGPFQPLRLAVYQDNFYDLQARAMFHGHLSLPNGALGIEGFVHDGRTYTYFGLFPSIIRMPILAGDQQPGRQAHRAVHAPGVAVDGIVRVADCCGESGSSFVATPPWAEPKPRLSGS